VSIPLTSRTVLLTVSAVCVGLAAAGRADANPAARLVYVRESGTEACPDEAAIRGAVAARLGYDPFFPSAPATMMVELSRDREGDGYRAHIQLLGEDGRLHGVRDIAQASPRCEDIIDTIALSVSIAIDPRSLVSPRRDVAAPPAVPAPPEPATTPPRPVLVAEKTDGAAVPRSHLELHLDAGVGAGGWIDAAPAPNASGELFLRLRSPRWSFAIEARGDVPASRTLSEGTVETWLAFGSVVPCVRVDFFHACIVGSAGVLHATSTAASPNDANVFHAAVGPRVGAELPLGRGFALWAHLDALWTLTQETLQINGRDVYPLPDASFGLTVGASVRFF
jgi:hypothetical protein